jgi:hypothetical protein
MRYIFSAVASNFSLGNNAEISKIDPPAFYAKQQEARGLYSVSALSRKVHTTRRSQEALHGFSQESTRTMFVSTRQDLEEQEEASKVQPYSARGLFST